MRRENLFFILFFFIILISRSIAKVSTTTELVIGNFVVHHFYTGSILLIFFFLFIYTLPRKKYDLFKTLSFSIIFAMIIDEITFVLIAGGDTYSQYWSIVSLIGTFVLMIPIFLLRKEIIKLIL